MESLYANITLIDVQLASAYYPLLVELAKHKHCLTYSELVELAKKRYPDKPVVQNAIAVSTGRRLDIVRLFTSERDLPDLSSLIINKSTGECGIGFTKHFNPIKARELVFSFDWSNVTMDFDGFILHTEKSITPRKKISHAQASQLMASHYMKFKDQLPSTVKNHRDLIIKLISEGYSADEAFEQAISIESDSKKP